MLFILFAIGILHHVRLVDAIRDMSAIERILKREYASFFSPMEVCTLPHMNDAALMLLSEIGVCQ